MKGLTITFSCVVVLAAWTLSADDAAAQSASPAGSRLSFAKAITFPTEVQEPLSIAAGDLNGDGFPDIAVVTPDGGYYPYLSYALGKGNGRFGSWQRGPGPPAPGGVVLADIERNGKLDALMVDGFGSDLFIDFGDGKGSFSSYEAINNVNPNYFVVVDVNGDKIPDVVGSGGGPNSVFVMLGQGKKKFGQPTTYPSGGDSPQGIAVGDLRHNGIRDLVVANNGNLSGGNANVAVLLGNGDGTFQNPATYPAGTEPLVVVLGDFNGDGNLDVAVCNSNSEVTVLLGKGDGTFLPAKSYPAGGATGWIATADFNGDGKLDLAVLAGNSVSVLLGNGDGTFQKPRKFGVGGGPWQLVVADFNHDGRPDIATVNNGDDSVSVLLNTTKFPVHPRRQH